MVTRVKICGITTIEDGLAATAAGADLLGFVFYDKSPRVVEASRVRKITDALRATTARPPLFVGVFVDEDWRRVADILEIAGLDLAQLHGSEPPLEVGLLAPYAFKALRPATRGDIDAMVATYAEVLPPTDPATAERPSFLIDAYHPWRFGGTGRRADWPAARLLAERYPILLAGGLTPENVQEALAVARPWGIDVSSGVERAPGQKDPTLMRAFVENARAVDAVSR